MKVLMISVFQNTGGYSDAATEQALALDSAGANTVCRSVSMDGTRRVLSDKMKELHTKDLNDVDVIYNYNLPSEFSFSGKVKKNVGGFCYETTGFPNTNWASNLSLLDTIIVPCEFMKQNMPKNLQDKICVVPIPLDTAKFDKTYDEMDFGLPKNCTKFYTIAEYNKRKNLPAMLISYFSAFTSNDNVSLIIKTGINGLSEEDSREKFKGILKDVKVGLNRFSNLDKYPKVILITQRLSDQNILSLHQSCDCYMNSSHGESFCIPAITALGMSNLAILPRYGSFLDIENECCCKLVGGLETTCFGYPNGLNLYSSSEKWLEIDRFELSELMKQAYISHQDKKWNKEFFKDSADNIKKLFNREVVGNQLRKALES